MLGVNNQLPTIFTEIKNKLLQLTPMQKLALMVAASALLLIGVLFKKYIHHKPSNSHSIKTNPQASQPVAHTFQQAVKPEAVKPPETPKAPEPIPSTPHTSAAPLQQPEVAPISLDDIPEPTVRDTSNISNKTVTIELPPKVPEAPNEVIVEPIEEPAGPLEKGKIQLSETHTYEGELFNNVPHGQGIIKNSRKTDFSIIGLFNHGKFRRGEVIESGEYIKGDFPISEHQILVSEFPVGMSFIGERRFDGVKYYGKFLKGRLYGEGRKIDFNGDLYEGHFENSRMSGPNCKITHKNNKSSEGLFQNDILIEGTGFLVSKGHINLTDIGFGYYVDGEYEGEIHDKIPNGKGKVKFGPLVFSGLFKQGVFIEGEMTHGKDRYIGTFNKYRLQDKGKRIIYQNETDFVEEEGIFENGHLVKKLNDEETNKISQAL